MATAKQSNEEKLAYLILVLKESTLSTKKMLSLFYTISLVKFGGKIPMLCREPAGTDINEQMKKYSGDVFKPDYIIVDLFTGRSRNVKMPLATFKFDYKSKF